MKKSPTIRAMEDAAIKAGRGLSRDFGEVENLQVSQKGPGDFVTSADLRAEQVLIEELQKFRPKYGFLLEESDEIKGKDEQYRWIIDPLDGTTNFMHGISTFCTSIGLEQTKTNGKKEIIAGVVFAPILNEMFWAEKNVGAFCNDRKITVSARDKFQSALFAAYPWHGRGSKYDSPEIAKEISDTTANVRITGSAALDLAYIAAGKLDGFWHDSLQAWDLAAGEILIREARGVITDINGENNIIETGSVIAGNEVIHRKLSALIKSHTRTA